MSKQNPKRFPKELRRAWLQYQDLYDRHMRLLRWMGEGDLNTIYQEFEESIEYAMNEWQSPEERFDSGSYDDLDLGLDGEEE